MTYLHVGLISEAHVSTLNGSSSGTDSSEMLNSYLIWINILGLLCFNTELVKNPQSENQ
jgi:hypothetical protein